MNLKGILLLATAVIALQACSNYQPRVYTPAPLAEGQQVELFNDFCYFDTEPNGAAFTVLKRAVVGGSFYGSTEGLKPKLEQKVKGLGGNSIANFKASQRFGFWPWRIIRPVVSGDAIQILNANGKSCEELGGHH